MKQTGQIYYAALVRKSDGVTVHKVRSVGSQSVISFLLRLSQQDDYKEDYVLVTGYGDYIKNLMKVKKQIFIKKYNKWIDTHKIECGTSIYYDTYENRYKW